MFFLFGFKIKNKIHKTVKYQACPKCETQEYELLSWRDWFHLFYIPIAPVEKKRYYLHCTKCGDYYQINEQEFMELLKN
ncbi:MAG: zinc-ribbon domain-containing protein [Mycoplasmatales bacterium]